MNIKVAYLCYVTKKTNAVEELLNVSTYYLCIISYNYNLVFNKYDVHYLNLIINKLSIRMGV